MQICWSFCKQLQVCPELYHQIGCPSLLMFILLCVMRNLKSTAMGHKWHGMLIKPKAQFYNIDKPTAFCCTPRALTSMVRVSLALRLALAASCWVMAAGFLRSFWLTKPSDASAKSPQIDALDTALQNYHLDTIFQDHHDRPPAGYNIELTQVGFWLCMTRLPRVVTVSCLPSPQAIATGILDAVQDMMLAQSSVITDFVSFLAPCTMGVTANDVDLMMLMTKMVDVIEHPGTLFATVAVACDSLDVPADATEEVHY
jgi:hypothetical protein